MLYCPRCHDLLAMTNGIRYCLCGRSYGRYEDEKRVLYGGRAAIVCIDNNELDKWYYRLIDYKLHGIRFSAYFANPKSRQLKKRAWWKIVGKDDG